MTQTTIDLTKIKDRDVAAALDVVGTTFEAGTFTGTATVVVGTAARELTISGSSGLMKLVPSGTDTNIDLQLQSAGTGVVAIGGTTTANSAMEVVTTASSVNFMRVTSGATGTGILIEGTGTDSTVDIALSPKSTGSVWVGGATTAAATAKFVTTASSVNQLVITSGATGSVVSLTGGGSGADSTVDIAIRPKSTGSVWLGGSTTANASVKVPTVASSVNQLVVTSGATGTGVTLAGGGSGADSTVDILISPKSTGTVWLGGTTTANASVKVVTVASAVNQIILTPAATGNAPSITVGGSGGDANRNLTINAIGTGAVVMGTNLARTVTTTISAAGTTRADATQLLTDMNKITTANASTGVILPVGIIGMAILVENGGANAVKVYATASETIDGTAGSTGVTLTNAKRCMYYFIAANTWISAQMGVVSG